MAYWRDLLKEGRSGSPHGNLANTLIVLRTAPEVRGAFKFDAVARRPMLFRLLDGRGIDPPRPLVDDDFTLACAWIQENILPNVSKGTVTDAVLAVAKENEFNPLTDALSGFEWDAESRLDDWLSGVHFAALFQPEVVAGLMIEAAQADIRASGAKQATAAHVERERTRLTKEIESLGVQEESWLRHAESVGITLDRRPDADPAFVLMDDEALNKAAALH